jgi:hypothetical protein
VVFAKSLHEDREADRVQGRVRARGGGESQWYAGADVSYLSCPEIFRGTVNFELINQIQTPGHCLPYHHFTLGQVVWKCVVLPAIHGCKVEYTQEPFVILSRCLTTYYYILMGTNGQVYPRLVSPEQLEPVQTMWTAAQIPSNWPLSKDIKRSSRKAFGHAPTKGDRISQLGSRKVLLIRPCHAMPKPSPVIHSLPSPKSPTSSFFVITFQRLVRPFRRHFCMFTLQAIKT